MHIEEVSCKKRATVPSVKIHKSKVVPVLKHYAIKTYWGWRYSATYSRTRHWKDTYYHKIGSHERKKT